MAANPGAGRGVIPERPVRMLPGRATGVIRAPGSKSVTNRLLVLAALAEGTSILRDPLSSDDTRAMAGVVGDLGATVTHGADEWQVDGTGGDLAVPGLPLDAGLSGTTMRFGMALAAVSPGLVTVTGEPPLLRRPVGPLSAALRSLGAEVEDADGLPPVRVRGPLRGGATSVDVSASSQFASALLMVAPYASDEDVELTLHGETAYAYVGLTATAMQQRGVTEIRRPDDHTWMIPRGQRYQACDATVEYDASAAAHLLCLAAATGGQLTVANADPLTSQPDAAFPDLLAQMGVAVHRDGGGVTVAASGTLRGAGRYSLRHMPDQLPCAAVLAALAEGTSEFVDAGVVRGHETDRIAALHTELRKLGIAVREQPDGLVITGGVPAQSEPVELATYDDHRLAMAFAALGAALADRVEVRITDPACVTKTYPRFWDDVRALGVEWEAA